MQDSYGVYVCTDQSLVFVWMEVVLGLKLPTLIVASLLSYCDFELKELF